MHSLVLSPALFLGFVLSSGLVSRLGSCIVFDFDQSAPNNPPFPPCSDGSGRRRMRRAATRVTVLTRHVFLSRARLTSNNLFRTMATSESSCTRPGTTATDPHKFLEDVLGEEPLAWVKERNANCIAAVGEPTQTNDYKRILSILDSKDKIPHIAQIGDGMFYNFWQDDKHGIMPHSIRFRTSFPCALRPFPPFLFHLWIRLAPFSAGNMAQDLAGIL